jgi:ornithine carbamoyltransferase
MIFAHPHSDIPPFCIKELAKYSPVPVLSALSSLWHPTQVLADLLTLHEHAHLFGPSKVPPEQTAKGHTETLPKLPSLTIAYVGDSANVLHDMLVTYPRLGHSLRIATPPKPTYQAPAAVWDRVKELKCDEKIWWGTDPREAVKGANVVITDTWCALSRPFILVKTNIWFLTLHISSGFRWVKRQSMNNACATLLATR